MVHGQMSHLLKTDSGIDGGKGESQPDMGAFAALIL